MKLPESLHQILAGYTAARVRTGASGARVDRFSRPGRRTLYLKQRTDTSEIVRLQWLAQYLPCPRVLQFGGGGRTGAAWMLTTALPGRAAYEVLAAAAGSPDARRTAVRAIAGFLRRLHALPAHDCPFAAGHSLRMAQAQRNLEAGLVDESDFDEPRQGWTASEVWSRLNALRPARVDQVVTHGDFSLDNIYLHRGHVTGVLDVGRLGIADPYQDLAILWNNLEEFGPSLQQDFLRAYGLARPNARKLEFHLCLDEFF